MTVTCLKCGAAAADYFGTPLCRNWACWDSKPVATPEGEEDFSRMVSAEMSALYRNVVEAVRRNDTALAYAQHMKAVDDGEEPPGAESVVSATLGVMANVMWNMGRACLEQQSPAGLRKTLLGNFDRYLAELERQETATVPSRARN